MSVLKPSVVCHAEGDKCLGCDHYQGKADVCVFAAQDTAIAELVEALESFVNNSSVAVNQPYEHEKAEALVAKHRSKP